jgi:hypothetical protein
MEHRRYRVRSFFPFRESTLVGHVLLIAAFTAIVQARGPIVRTATGMQRVGPTEPAREDRIAELFAARGEYEPFQVVVKAQVGGLRNVTFRIGDLKGPHGQVIPRANMTVYREHYVRVEHGSSVPKNMRRPPLGPGWYADALIPEVSGAANGRLLAFPFDLEAGRNQPIWVDVFVPRDAAAGTYTGAFELRSPQGSARGRVRLTVWNFALPAKPSLASSFGLRHDRSSAACEMILRHKLMPIPVNAEDAGRFATEFGLEWFNLRFSSGATWDKAEMLEPPSVETIAQHVFPVHLVVEQIETVARLFLRFLVQLPLKHPDLNRCFQAHRQSPLLSFFQSTSEVRVLSSTGVTRLPRSYDPLRLPDRPSSL